MRKRFVGLQEHQRPALLRVNITTDEVSWGVLLTLTPWIFAIDACTRHKNIINDGENALTSHPTSVFVLDSAIVQNGRLVHMDAFVMDELGEWNFVMMEVVPASLVLDFVRFVAQDVLDRIGGILDPRMLGQICGQSA